MHDARDVADATANDPLADFRRLLNRPPSERSREYRYRFAQSLIFGIPVLALEWLGPRLSGSLSEAARWIPPLQAILTGWICYIGALGMLVEGLVVIRRKLRADLFIAAASVSAYLYSLISVAGIFMRGQSFYRPLLFHIVVLILATWNGLQWARLRIAAQDASQ